MKKAFNFEKDQLSYTLKIRRKRNFWWLLLLLLPVLLLVRCEKTIYVKTINADTKLPVANVEVNFKYTRSFLYYEGSFFNNTHIDSVKTSDANGIAPFFKLRYSVFSYIFHHFSLAEIIGNGNCYTSDTLRPFFHSLSNNDTLKLNLHAALTTIDFKVVDKDDQQPLPNADVQIVFEMDGHEFMDSAKSNPDGKVVFSRLPKCGKLVRVTAGIDGYYPDSIINKNSDDLIGNIEAKRMLQLKPIRKPIEFFVIDCRSKEPIAGAAVSIEFEVDGKQVIKKVTTNVDGQGKGTYDDAHVIAKIHIKGSQTFYKDGELPGWYLVRDFITYPIEKRTFCLDPAEIPLVFTNIDSITKLPLSGVVNTISIIRDGKEIVPKQISWSNRNGNFNVSIEKGDTVSILSQHQTDYEDNNTKIQNSDAAGLIVGDNEKRTIPLKPKAYEKPPKESCRVFVSGKFVGDEYVENNVSVIYEIDEASEYVGEGIYPDNLLAFPKAVNTTFDGIAIDKGTRVIIYSEKNFQGEILLDQQGPALINNGGRLTGDNSEGYKILLERINAKKFKEPLQTNFPPNTRSLSKTNMIDWSNGSMKVICNK